VEPDPAVTISEQRMTANDSQHIATWLAPACTRAQTASATWQDAVAQTIRLLVDSGAVDESYAAAVIERERVFPTGLPTEPFGVALPHATGEVHRSALALLTVREPVAFAQMGDPDDSVPVRVVIGLAVRDPQDQVPTLESLIQLIQQPAFLESLVEAQDDEALYRAWRAWTSDTARKD
jgi:galactitol PTS system EIIA component